MNVKISVSQKKIKELRQTFFDIKEQDNTKQNLFNLATRAYALISHYLEENEMYCVVDTLAEIKYQQPVFGEDLKYIKAYNMRYVNKMLDLIDLILEFDIELSDENQDN